MNHLDRIKIELDKLNSEIASCGYEHEDIRKSYLELLLSVLNQFYFGYANVLLSYKIALDPGAVLFHRERLESTADHINNFHTEMRKVEVRNNAINSLNRNLIIDSWSVFEFCITNVCQELLSEEEIEQLKSSESNEFFKIFKNEEISEDSFQKLKKKTYKKELPHVAINRKYNRLFKTVEGNYIGTIPLDRSFLDFYGRYRNCIHSNYIYYGSDYEFRFKGIKFIFHNNKPVFHDEDLPPLLHFDLAIHLKNLARQLFASISTEKLLKDPSL